MSSSPPRPLKPVSSATIEWESWEQGTRFGSRTRHLTRAAVGGTAYHVGVVLEELPPGKQSCPFHYHIHEEEHVFVLAGSLTLRLGRERFDMKPGDYACFPAGVPLGHCLENYSDSDCRYIVVGERRADEVCVYPDSNKVAVDAVGRTILDLAATRGYWHGEDTGEAEAAQPGPTDGAQEAPRPRPPISVDDVEWRQEGVPGSRHFGGESRHLTFEAVGAAYHVGMLIESPAPGKRIAPRHYHMVEEEHAFILEGEATLLLGDERYTMREGDYVCLPAGQRLGHSIENSGSGPCRYLMIGESSPNEVCVYPDSNKVYVRALEPEPPLFDMAAKRRYWDGEQTD